MLGKKKLWGIPLTIVGLVFGLLVGSAALLKELYYKEHPTIGLIIIFVSPVLSFIFEQIMRIAFPEIYWEKIASNIFWFIRYISNESFRMRFIYELRFPLETLPKTDAISSDAICDALHATPGGDPEPTSIGENFVHLRFSSLPFSVVLKWSVEELDENTEGNEKAETVFVITMEPETRDFVLRNGRNDIEALLARLQDLQQNLADHLRNAKPKILLTIDVWLGSSLPPATPIPRPQEDKISGAKYRLYPGRLHVAGTSSATLSAVYRCMKLLEPPPQDNAPS